MAAYPPYLLETPVTEAFAPALFDAAARRALRASMARA